MKGLPIGRRRARTELPSSPLELALRPALEEGRWRVPDRFNFTRDVVEALASDPKRRALTFLSQDGVIEPRTFLEIAEGATRWAQLLRGRDVRPDDRVLVVARSSLGWIEALLGVLKIGAVAVPCSPSLSVGALEARVSDTAAALLIAEPALEATIERMSFTPDVHYLEPGRRSTSKVSHDDEPTHDTSSRDLAVILSTSGAAGPPKAVAHAHGSIFAMRVQAEHWLDIGRGDVVWCTPGTDSPHAVWNTLVGPWSRGAEVVLSESEPDALERLDLLYRLGPTILYQTPADYRALAEVDRLERYRSARLRRLVCTGDVLDPEVAEEFENRWGMTIHEGYGQAETGVLVANGADGSVKAGSLGRALPGHHVSIVDGEGNELPTGIEGDLAVRGRPPTMFAGYWDAPEETKAAFRGDWYITGDVALADEEGYLWFVGRAEDVITSSGRTFGPAEVEHALRGHAAIAAAAVVGIRDLQRGGHFVRAFVVPRPGQAGSEQLQAEVRQYAADLLPEQQVPREIVFVDELPTVAGKISRHALRERPVGGRPLWDLPPTSDPLLEAPPADEIERPTTIVAAAAPAAEAAPEAPPSPAPAHDPSPELVVVPPVAPEPVLEPPSYEPVSRPEPRVELVAEPSPDPVADALPEPVAEALPEPEPVEELEAEPSPEPVAEALPEPVAEALPQPEPEPVEELVVAPSSEPVAEALPEPEPEPDIALERDPEPAGEVVLPAEPVDEPRPEPPLVELRREPEPEPQPPPVSEAEGQTVPPLAADAEPAQVPAQQPEPISLRAPTPEREPQPAEREPEPAPEPEPELGAVAQAQPPHEAEQPARHLPEFPLVEDPEEVSPIPGELLPDFVVPPDPDRFAPPRVERDLPPTDPEPEEEDLGPLPDYVIDPHAPRSAEPRVRPAEPQDREPATPTFGLAPSFGTPRAEPPSEPDPSSSTGLNFPAVASFQIPTNGPRSESDKPERTTPRRRGAGPAKSAKSRSQEEPGDEGVEAGWMEGLSNRLSAYSLAEEQEGATDAERVDEPNPDD